MPAFSSDQISDAQVQADFAVLAARDLGKNAAGAGHPSLSWDEKTINEKLARGRIAWRMADNHGNACMNCHSPDGIELAVIGFSDGDITRRAAEHLPWQDVLAVVDYVHALRRRLEVDAPCDPLAWRPFQPGGEPLPGKTIAEQDASFGKMLSERGHLAMTSKVETLADARAVAKEFATTDLKTLPIGINLPRWSEDPFHGEEHRTHNDWMSDIAQVPVGSEWYRLIDQYLDDPTDTNLAALVDAAAKETKVGETDAPYETGAYPGSTARSHVEWVSHQKYVNVLIGTHFMRTQLSGRQDFQQRGQQALAFIATDRNPFLDIGSRNAEGFCYNNKQCSEHTMKTIPKSAFEDMPYPKTDETYTTALSHSWFTLGQIFDQTLTTGIRLGFAESFPVYWNVFKVPARRLPSAVLQRAPGLRGCSARSE